MSINGTGPVVRRFSASQAAFAGFGLLAREPLTWAIWSAAFLVLSLVFGAGLVAAIGPSLTQLMQASSTGASADPAVAMTLFSRILPFEGLLMVVSLGLYAVAFAAVNRALLRPGAGGPGHLALGGDELRQLLVLVIIGAILFAVYIVAVIVGVVLGVMVGLSAGAAAASGANAGAMAGPAALLILAIVFVVFGLIVWVMTRLSLASPMTFDLERVEVFSSWTLTRGRFWQLFGAYLLAWLMLMILYIAAACLFAVLAVTIGGGLGAAGVMFRPDFTTVAGYFTPMMVVWVVISSILAPVAMAVGIGTSTSCYAQLRDLGHISPAGTSAVPPTPPDPGLPKFGH